MAGTGVSICSYPPSLACVYPCNEAPLGFPTEEVASSLPLLLTLRPW